MSKVAEQLEAIAQDAMSRCTTCGACFEACPTAREVGLPRDDSKGAVRDLMELTKGESGRALASRWVEACNASGNCTAACPEGINVRQWVSIARLKNMENKRSLEQRAANAAQRFRTMAQSVRLLASMQMPSETLRRIMSPVEKRKADVIFYTGCNVLKTPHIVLSVMDVLDVLGVDYDVAGGTSHCCGVYQFLDGDLETYEKIGGRTFERFAESKATQVLTWCPSCQKQFGEVEADRAPPPFKLDHVSQYLAANLEKLRPHFIAQPSRRAALHFHDGLPGNVEGIKALLRAIPGLELVDVPQDSAFSYMCYNAMAAYREREGKSDRALLEAAQQLGVDIVVTMYHSCQRNLCGAEAHYPFQVRNFTELLAEAVGRGGHPDNFKRFKTGQSLDEAIIAARGYLQQNGVRVGREQMEALGVMMFEELGPAGDKVRTIRALTSLGDSA